MSVPTLVLGFAVVHQPRSDGPMAIWHVSCAGRSATNSNAVVVDVDDPDRATKVAALVARRCVVLTDGTSPSADLQGAAAGRACAVHEVGDAFVDDARVVDDPGDRLPPVSSELDADVDDAGVAAGALTAANYLSRCWTYWLRAVRKGDGGGRRPAWPPSVVTVVGLEKVHIAGEIAS